jgi:hypothetical protein
MIIDYMISTWNRFEIPDSYKDSLMAFLKENPKANGWQIYDWFSNQVDYDPEEQRIQEDDECVTPAQNNNEPTVIIYGDPDDYEPIYTNLNTQVSYREAKMAEFRAEIQKIQNSLRDWRDSDPQDNDAYWYSIIDAVSDLTGVAPE